MRTTKGCAPFPASVLTLVLMAALTIAGCGGGGGTNDGPGDGTNDGTNDGGAVPGDEVGPVVPGGAGGNPGDADLGLDGDSFRVSSVVESSAEGGNVRIENRYDERGLIDRQTFFENGEAREVRTFEYDDESRLLERRDDVGIDDTTDSSRRYGYGNGVLATIDVFDAGGTLALRTSFDFAEDGTAEAATLTRYRFDDGTPLDTPVVVSRTRYAYEGGRLVSEGTDLDDDGMADSTKAYSYRNNGTLESTTTSTDQGTPESSVWEYESGPCSLAWTNSTNAWFCVANDGG